MECKDFLRSVFPVSEPDLIETLWNVKFLSSQFRKQPGFNRDIVECKAVPETGRRAGGSRFNRDIVECKENSCSAF